MLHLHQEPVLQDLDLPIWYHSCLFLGLQVRLPRLQHDLDRQPMHPIYSHCPAPDQEIVADHPIE